MPRTKSGLFAPLRERSFRNVWFGESIATFGATAQTIIMAVLALQQPHAGLTLGLLLLVGGLPRIAFMLAGGALSDRFSPRAVMWVSYLSRAGVMAVLFGLAALGDVQLWQIYAIRFAYGVADAAFAPAVTAIIPRVVSKDQLPAANALHRTVLGIGSVGGNAVAGLVVAFSSIAVSALGAALTFLVAALALLAVKADPLPTTTGAAKSGLLRSIGEGLNYLWTGRTTRVIVLLTAILTLAVAGPINVGVPALAQLRFGDPSVLGMLFSAYGVGTVAGSALAGVVSARIRRVGVALVVLGAAFGAGVVVLGFADTPVVAAIVVAPVALTGAMFNVAAIAVLQAESDPAYLGRVMSWFSASGYGVNPLSNVLSGLMVDSSLTGMFVVCGGAAVLVSAVSLGLPAITRIVSAPPDAGPDPSGETSPASGTA